MTNPRHICVALCGSSGAGKSTVAAKVKEIYHFRQLPCVVRKFAQPIIDGLRAMGVDRDHPMYRELAQYVGGRMREHDIGHWVAIEQSHLNGLSLFWGYDPRCVVLYDDVRHPNEANGMDLVVTLLTDRPNGLTEVQRSHPSENEWRNVRSDVVYCNDRPEDVGRIAGDVVELIERIRNREAA